MAFSAWTLDDINNWMDSGYQWTGNTITYAFPTSVTPMGKDRGGFTAFTANQITQVKLAIMGWDDLIKQNFQQITVASTDDVYKANIEYARSTVVSGGVAKSICSSSKYLRILRLISFCTLSTAPRSPIFTS